MAAECKFKQSSTVVKLFSYTQGVAEVGVKLEDNKVAMIVLTWPDSEHDWIGHIMPGGMTVLEDLHSAIENMLATIKNVLKDGKE